MRQTRKEHERDLNRLQEEKDVDRNLVPNEPESPLTRAEKRK